MLQRVLTSLGGRRRPAGRGGESTAVASPTGLAGAVDVHRPERDPPWPQVELLHLPLPAERPTPSRRRPRWCDSAPACSSCSAATARTASWPRPAARYRSPPLSTGTNNAFAQLGEATVSGLAAGLLATGHAGRRRCLPAQQGPGRRASSPGRTGPGRRGDNRRRLASAPAPCGTRARSPSSSSRSPSRASSGSRRSPRSSDRSDVTSRSACASCCIQEPLDKFSPRSHPDSSDRSGWRRSRSSAPAIAGGSQGAAWSPSTANGRSSSATRHQPSRSRWPDRGASKWRGRWRSRRVGASSSDPREQADANGLKPRPAVPAVLAQPAGRNVTFGPGDHVAEGVAVSV